MNRRDALLALLALGTVPPSTQAQQAPKLARIGFLSSLAAPKIAAYADHFRTGLRDFGYVEGRNVEIDFRYADGDNDLLPGLAAELVKLKVDVIVTYATGVRAARAATATIPIVQANAGDPVAAGFAASLAHPGGNVTGLAFFLTELMTKRVELLKEVKTKMTRAGVLLLRDLPSNHLTLEAMAVAARALRVELLPVEVSGPAEFEKAFSEWDYKKIQGLIVHDNPQFTANTSAIAALAAKRGLASIGPLELSAAGGLMAYGVNFYSTYRRAAFFVDKILKGAKPGDLPIEQATEFDFIVNMKTANALGIEIPQSIMVRTTRVIE